MNLPDGRLVHSRVVREPGVALRTALDRSLTGYAILAPQESLLLDANTRAVLTFEEGVPALVEEPATDRTGPEALATIAGPGPYSVDLYESPVGSLPDPEAWPERTVPPAMPAERLAGDPPLAERTRAAASAAALERRVTPGDVGAVEAFLADEAKIEAIREQARGEVERRAEEWDLADELV